MGYSSGHALNAVDASLGTSAFVATVAPMRCRFMTANGTGTTNGTEVVNGGGYTGGASAPTVGFAAAAVSGNFAQAASNTAVTVTNWPRGETVVGVELWDSAATPVRKHWGPLTTPKGVAIGDTLSVAAAALQASLGLVNV